MTALPSIPATTKTPHSGALIQELRVAKSDARVSAANCEMNPSDTMTPHRSSIVAVPAKYMELRASSIVEWMAPQLSCGVSDADSWSVPCIVCLLCCPTSPSCGRFSLQYKPVYIM